MVRLNQKNASSTIPQDPDAQLMLLVRQGSTQAFELLWQRYHQRIRSTIIHLMGSDRNCDDLTQDVFLRVYRARASYQPTAKFSTWLFTIVNNVVLNARRSLAVRRESQLTAQDRFCGSLLDRRVRDSMDDLPDQYLERQESREVVRQAMSQLSERQQQAIWLCNYQQQSHAMAARKMNTSPDAIKSLLHRARTALRCKLEPYVAQGRVDQLQAS